MDPPGQGRTLLHRRGIPFGTDEVAGSLNGFLDAVGIRDVAVVGHSWGGGYGLRLTQLYPDRVTRLALIAPGGLDVRDVWEFRLMRLLL